MKNRGRRKATKTYLRPPEIVFAVILLNSLFSPENFPKYMFATLLDITFYSTVLIIISHLMKI